MYWRYFQINLSLNWNNSLLILYFILFTYSLWMLIHGQRYPGVPTWLSKMLSLHSQNQCPRLQQSVRQNGRSHSNHYYLRYQVINTKPGWYRLNKLDYFKRKRMIWNVKSGWSCYRHGNWYIHKLTDSYFETLIYTYISSDRWWSQKENANGDVIPITRYIASVATICHLQVTVCRVSLCKYRFWNVCDDRQWGAPFECFLLSWFIAVLSLQCTSFPLHTVQMHGVHYYYTIEGVGIVSRKMDNDLISSIHLLLSQVILQIIYFHMSISILGNIIYAKVFPKGFIHICNSFYRILFTIWFFLMMTHEAIRIHISRIMNNRDGGGYEKVTLTVYRIYTGSQEKISTVKVLIPSFWKLWSQSTNKLYLFIFLFSFNLFQFDFWMNLSVLQYMNGIFFGII